MSDNAYNERLSRVENQTAPSLWDRLGTTRNAFRIYSHDKVPSSSFFPIHFQTLTYSITSPKPNSASRSVPHARTHDLPPGAIIWAHQIEHHLRYEPCRRHPRKIHTVSSFHLSALYSTNHFAGRAHLCDGFLLRLGRRRVLTSLPTVTLLCLPNSITPRSSAIPVR